MRTTTKALIFLFVVGGLTNAATIVLKRAWVEKFKDRATIDATFTIDHARPRPNTGAKDGDMHVAGRAPKEIGLPMVAEVMNADNKQAAVKLIHDKEGKDEPIAVTGAWRLWFEHPPSTGSQIQFDTVPPADNTNPDHCFEIHPLTKVGPNDVTASLHDVSGFIPKTADAAFGAYEKMTLSLTANSSAVTLTSSKAGFNYVQFTMQALGKGKALTDGGLAIMADVLSDAGDQSEAIAQGVRMIFVAGSEPFKKAGGLKNGDELTVLGIPRLNLNAVSTLLAATGSSVTKRKLPYEIIVVGLEGDSAAAPAKGKPKKP